MAGERWIEEEARRLAAEAYESGDMAHARGWEAVARGIRAGLAKAAKLCGERASESWRLFKQGGALQRGDTRHEAASDEAEACERAIRALMGGG